MKLRAHNLLCIQGFVGKGYSPEFAANMARVVESLGESAGISVIDEPDALCSACPNLSETGCALHGQGTESGIVRQDRNVLRRLGLESGTTVTWGDILERIREKIAPDDLDDICGACPWLPMGHCKEGLRRLREGY